METVTKEIYREYLCNRLKDLTVWMEQPARISESLKHRLEVQRDIDYIMQQLYLLDNEE